MKFMEESSNFLNVYCISQMPFITPMSWESDISVNLFTIRNIQVSSSNFIMNNICSATPNRASIITSIPITVNMGSIINYRNINNISSLIHELTNINNLHIQLLDQDGDLLDLNGLHWSINLLLTIE
jgi:4-hydroxy-3-methylbut-2-enyl diphosphate reductase IspH